MGDGGSTAAVTLLSNGELDTLALGQRDPGLLVTNDENVALTGSEGVVNSILDVDDVETTIVALTVGDDTNTTHVATTSDHGDGTSVELDEVSDLASGKVDLHGVVDLDGGVRVADAGKAGLVYKVEMVYEGLHQSQPSDGKLLSNRFVGFILCCHATTMMMCFLSCQRLIHTR